eukprot:TRINITY_DN37984_c0_g1_i1.p2 TRINITY_DN37984_c0_g1~~TRINITY_DN37984_c0_g1_i1.p2  ORF type:complete len:370 (+),score=134.60 TRINITY_DN37984_c0_g1_i1:1300-2409(+)
MRVEGHLPDSSGEAVRAVRVVQEEEEGGRGGGSSSCFAPPSPRGEGSPRRSCVLRVEGWHSGGELADGLEGLIFLPGFNCPTSYAAERLAQLLALGDFPTYVRPFVYGWPGGRELTFFQALRDGACAPATAAAFCTFLRGLHGAGFRRLHVFAHSMGARCFLSCFEVAQELFTVIEGVGAPADSGGAARPGGLLQLRTATLLNPEADLETFCGQDYVRLRRCCDHITVYADADDGALWYAEKFLRRPSLGRSVVQLRSQGAPAMHTEQRSPAAAVQSLLSFQQPPPLPEEPLKLPPGAPLDVDVVDTTWIDANVHSMRHNYFNLNSVLVDDLREVVTTQRRARDRTQLQYREKGNVYNFMAAPKIVKNA